jgi:outer membrane protein OmpA-like peptidoglycan-associated protein
MMTPMRLRFSIVLSLGFLMSQAQLIPNIGPAVDMYNFVPDPSFEMTKDLPCGWNQGIGKFNGWMVHWTSPTETTPDLFSNKVKESCWSHPTQHSDGRQRPKDGDNMVGIKVYGKGGTDTYWHEYVQVELKEPLKKDSLYYLAFHANLSARASKACNNIGAAVVVEPIEKRDRFPLYFTPTINSEKVLKQSILGWKKVDGVFKAQGDERYLVIGNFYRDEHTQMERQETGKDGAYYYIDDVTLRRAVPGEKVSSPPSYSPPNEPLIKLEERATTAEVQLPKVEYEVGTTIELRNISFEFDKADLLPSSQKELNRLADLMTDYPFMVIEISGHTDNQGAISYNQTLSEQRAQAVVAYLIHKQVDKERLSFKGYGSSIPIADNATEEGRSINRRVEFRVMQN